MTDKEATLVGCGALGSHFVQFMRSVDVRMKLIDFDRVSTANTKSQFHSKPIVGKNKTLALSTTMSFLYGTKYATVPHKLTSDNVKELLSNSSLVIDAVDNSATRRLIQSFVRANNVPCLHGALDANGSYGKVAWDEHFTVDDEDSVGQATCENGEHLPFIALVSAYMARAAQTFFASGERIGFDVHPGGAFRTA